MAARRKPSWIEIASRIAVALVAIGAAADGIVGHFTPTRDNSSRYWIEGMAAQIDALKARVRLLENGR